MYTDPSSTAFDLASWLLSALYGFLLFKEVAATRCVEERPTDRSGAYGPVTSSLLDDLPGQGSRGVAEDELQTLAEAYKEQIFNKLSELVPGRIAQIERAELEGKTTEEVLSLLYMQGVAEALDAFDVAELLRAAGDDLQGISARA